MIYNVQAIVAEAFQLSQKGNTKEALALLLPLKKQCDHVVLYHYVLGVVYHALGQLEKAERSFKSGYRLNPRDVGILSGLGLIAMARFRYEVAVGFFDKSFLIQNDPSFLNNKGVCLEVLGRSEEALTVFSTCVAQYPYFAEAYVSRAQIYVAIGMFDLALKDYQAVCQNNRGHIGAWCGLGALYMLLGDMAQAMACYDHIERYLGERHIEAHEAIILGKGRLAMTMGDLEAAQHHYQRLMNLLPRKSIVCFEYAEILHSLGDKEAMASCLIQGMALAKKEKDRKAHDYYALGKAYHLQASYDQALRTYDQAHQLERAYLKKMGRHYHIEDVDKNISDMKQCFGVLDFSQSYQDDHPMTPIFVVGMPRSGTSLVEHILSAHSMVSGAGELKAFPLVVDMIKRDVKGWDALKDEGFISHCRAVYRKHVEAFNTAYVVDKLPGNFLFLGLIRKIFPRAIIIHVERNAWDTCLSNYMQAFSADVTFHHEAETLAHYYTQVYRKMMTYWSGKDVDFKKISYDALVSAPEDEIKLLLDNVGLPFEAACLRAHKQTRTINTASRLQARKEIYKDSSGRAEKTYPAFVQRLKACWAYDES